MGSRFPMGRGDFEGKSMPGHARRHSDVNWAKTAEPIEMPFGLWIQVGSRKLKHVLDGAKILQGMQAIIRDKDMPGHARRHSAVSCATSAQQLLRWATVWPQ